METQSQQVTALNPIQNAPALFASGNVFGSGGHHTQMQQGNDAGITNLNLGQQGFGPSYDSNTQGSFENAYNGLLNQYTPDQLIARYAQGNQSQYATGTDRANAAAYNSATSLLGRAPTGNELAQILPAFQQSTTYGNAILANLANQWRQNPNAQGNQNVNSDMSNHINQVFQSMLGRGATQNEIQHFGSLMNTGNLDAYGLQQFVTGTPEYQNQQNTQFRSGLESELNNVDLNFFNQARGQVASNYAQNGTQQSTALDSAMTSLMGQIQNQNNQYIAGISAAQYGGNQQLALNNYGNTLNNMMGQQQYQRQNSANNIQGLTDYSNARTAYNTQLGNFMNYQQGQQPNNMLNYINTGINAARTGYNFLNQ